MTQQKVDGKGKDQRAAGLDYEVNCSAQTRSQNPAYSGLATSAASDGATGLLD